MTRSILIADDHPLFRQALRLAVEGVAPDARILEAGTLDDARIGAATPDLALILLDLRMPGAIGCSGVALLHAARADVPILVVSSAEDGEAMQAARTFGAIGFLGKAQPLDVMERVIWDALEGVDPTAPAEVEPDDLTARVASLAPMQLRVLLAAVEGRLNKQIAFDLGITESTVKAHMTVVLRKLGVTNRTQAASALRDCGLVFTAPAASDTAAVP